MPAMRTWDSMSQELLEESMVHYAVSCRISKDWLLGRAFSVVMKLPVFVACSVFPVPSGMPALRRSTLTRRMHGGMVKATADCHKPRARSRKARKCKKMPLLRKWVRQLQGLARCQSALEEEARSYAAHGPRTLMDRWQESASGRLDWVATRLHV